MEMPIESPGAGTISAIKVKEGDAVDEGAVVAVLG
jgi:biotin carboxyl carrier protein